MFQRLTQYLGASRAEQEAGGHSLRRKLLISTAITLACTAFLAATIIARSYHDYRLARENLSAIVSYRAILDTANFLSAERGPSNSLLGAHGTEPPLQERLASFRARSDEGLKRVRAQLGSVDRSNNAPPFSLFNPVKEQLLKARTEIDRLAALPQDRRPIAEVQAAIEGMFKVVDLFQPIIIWKINAIITSNPALRGQVTMCHIFGDLREYGGRIASQVMAPIAVRQPQSTSNMIKSRQTEGRILELWHLAQTQTWLAAREPRLAENMRETQQMFLGEGLPLVDRMLNEGRHSGGYSLTAAEFTDRYVATLQPLERLRQIYFGITVESLTNERDGSLRTLVWSVLTTSMILAFLAGLLRTAQKSVFEPLLRARDNIIELAEDRQTAPYPLLSHRASEMQRLFDAIEILRDSLFERASATEQFRQLAETDGLTGIMNRRSLDRIGENQNSDATGQVCLILMDIDHFKSINDRHGHPIGDRVLKEAAQLIDAMLRESDIFARYGGEEFAILTMESQLGRAAGLADRIRSSLEALSVPLADGTPVNITASFGVASGTLGRRPWKRLVEAADAALYQAKTEGRNCVRIAVTDAPSVAPDDKFERESPKSAAS